MGPLPPPGSYNQPPVQPTGSSSWYPGDQRLPSLSQVAPGSGGGNDLPRPIPHRGASQGGGLLAPQPPHLQPPPPHQQQQQHPHPHQQQQHHPSQQPTRPVITIYEVNPQQGFEGTPISVTCDFKFPPPSDPAGPRPPATHEGNRVRLILGGTYLDTTVQGPSDDNQPYIVRAVAPPFHMLQAPSLSVPMVIEAVTDRNILESAPLGDFHYLDDGGLSKRPRLSTSGGSGPIKREGGSPSRKMTTPTRRLSTRHEPYPTQPMTTGAPSTFVYDSPPPTPQPGLVRTTQMVGGAPQHNTYSLRTKARLEIEGDLNAMKQNWTQSMWTSRRCLVQFQRRQVGATVHVTFKAIEERDWTPNMIVISCLYHDARSECYFTSVDAIYLLECLMGTRYTTEEKNRIRRNLESFKPTTLKKNEGQWQDFYAHIMSYPNPKPRNIDKGLKVFPWAHLEQALKKIFGNYSAYSPSPSSNAQYTYNPVDLPPVAYAHGPGDSVNFADERAMAHPGPSGSGGDMGSGYVDMGGGGGQAGYRFMAGMPGAGSSGGGPFPGYAKPPESTPYGAPAHSDAPEFTSYVNVASGSVPSYPSREYQPMGYPPMQGPPPDNSGLGPQQTQYAYPEYARGPPAMGGQYDSRSDSTQQMPGPPAQAAPGVPHNPAYSTGYPPPPP